MLNLRVTHRAGQCVTGKDVAETRRLVHRAGRERE